MSGVASERAAKVGKGVASMAHPERAEGQAVDPRPPNGAGSRLSRRHAKWLVRAGAIAAFLVAWQVYGEHVNAILLVLPTAIVGQFGTMLRDGVLLNALGASLEALVIGFGGGLVAGVTLGVIWARFAVVDWAIQPFVSALWSTPLIALVPLYVLWFGFGLLAQVMIIASFTFFPILLNTYQGASSVDQALLEVARTYGCTNWQTWKHVTIPSAIPYILAGLNVAIGHALTGMIIAEFYTNAVGLGGIVLKSADTFQTARMFVPIVTLMLLGIVTIGSTRRLKSRFAKWSTLSEQK